ncbi:dna repair rad16 [Fusarium albosuccineum]|uniref:Dna repair rad16 n=2 Tax=Fusarium decemcellulare species complex TaxID=1329916 RepID=A0A8H4P8F6_9HYPO|nr:dna repair rad16 [Fusarium albosuccineum]
MPRGRPSTRGTPAALSAADASRDTSTASVRMTRSALTRSQAASSASTPRQDPEPEPSASSVPRSRGRPRKSNTNAGEAVTDAIESGALDDLLYPNPPPKRRGRPSKASVLESESTSSVPTQDATSESGYSTPATSKVPTPAALDYTKPTTSLEVQIRGPARPAAADRERGLRNSMFSMQAGPKGKAIVIANSDDEDFLDDSRDAKVARRLQEEEFAQSSKTSASSSLPRRRSTRASLPAAIIAPEQIPVKRGRASTGTTTKRGRPSKKAKVIPDSDDPDIDMDAEIAAAAGLDTDDDLLGLDSDDMSFEELDDASDDDQAAYVSSDDDIPLAKTRVKAKNVAPVRPRGRAARTFQTASGDEELTDMNHDGFDPLDSLSALGTSDTDDSSADEGAAALRAVAASRRAYRATGSSRRLKKERERLEANHPELKTMWDELENMPVINAGKAPQPVTISRQLKPFQLEGLAWMLEMEKKEWKGGLLGDEMGLGKTIQAVSLIMSDYPAKQPTLVLVPPVALMQWQQEIKSYTDGTLKTFVFHGTNQKTKGITVRELKKYDVIMMSYNSLESIYRKQEKGFKRKDGIYKEKSVIHSINFHRIILDEAHSIKTRTTMTAKACFALKTTYRWCLTGTPLQNRIGEFFSLVRFLNIRPFASYLCKQCPCSTLEWSMDEDSRCVDCKHASMQHVSVFNQELLNPIQKYGNLGPGREAFRKLRLMTDRIMLRRLKKDHTNSMELPVKEIYVDRQFFGEEENDFANSIMTNGQRKFDTYVAQGVLLNNYANIFGLIMQMRQVADHPDLILKKNSEGGQNVLVCCICDEPAEDTVRSRCKHDFCRACVSSYVRSTAEPDCPRCHIPLAIDLEQPEIEQDENLVKKNSIINRIKMENWTSSSKIELLVHELHKLRSDNASHKSIIFSQFTTMLQLIEWRLRRAGITTVMLDGSMTPAQRQASIEHFMTNVDVECFLVSLKAGGVALNLTEASRVFIVDPWWNPAAEWQSADRCHRIGQTRPCTITRLCIEDSVESRMVLIQEKKTNMIHSTVNADDKAMDSLTPQDMQFLFRGS